MLVSERIGQFFLANGDGRDRLEYTEYGGGERWVVLLHGQLMPRRMQQPLARALAAEGLHVVTLDLLGHGRSDRPADPLVYSMSSFADQVEALLDHLGAEKAVIGGLSLGANVSLEFAATWPHRVQGLIIEMPVLNNALHAAIVAFVPLMFAARYLPWTVSSVRALSRPVPRGLVPFWAGIALDTLDQRPASVAAVIHGIIFGRVAPQAKQRRAITAPALVVGHPTDPIHPFADAAMLAEEMPHAAVRGGPQHPGVALPPRAAELRRGRVRAGLLGRQVLGRASYGARPRLIGGCGGQNGQVPLYRDEAVVLRTHKLGEADRIITLLTRHHGRVRAVAKGVRKTTSRWGSRLEPFTHVDLQLAVGRSLDIVTQAETIEPFASGLGLDYARYTAGTVMLETADRLVTEEGQPAVQQFLLLVGGLRAMTAGDPAPDGAPTRSSTPTCCARWRWPATRRRSATARGAVTRGRTRRSAPRPAERCAPTAGCPARRHPRRGTLDVLGALLAGDWDVVAAADPRALREASGLVSAYLHWHLERGLRSLEYVER